MASKPRRANLKGPGRCIFCGSHGLTHEHMYPDWMKNYIPRTAEYHTTGVALVHPHCPEEQTTIRKRMGDFHARRIYCVCGECNSGWMSRLQQEAKPFLVPMLEGREIVLHKRAQRLLAAWTAMMVMAAEYVEPDLIAIPASDRAFLREEKRPPAHWNIWIGTHCNKNFPLYSHFVSEFIENESYRSPTGLSESPNTQTTTICVGNYLVIFVMSSFIGRELFRRWKLPAPIRASMHKIWPHGIRTGDVRWRPDWGLNDAGVALLANHFFDKAAEIAGQ